ncbi:hypothetical protein JB92DRAFT_346364 [Gautieria morchelliformis]|nr:hypothetical protein JB92DRAFT_346364 [Gautieria morchelliformis]
MWNMWNTPIFRHPATTLALTRVLPQQVVFPDSLRRRGRDLSTQMSKLPAYAEQFVLILLAAACYLFFLPGNRCPLPDHADTSPSRVWVFPFLASVRSLPSLFFFYSLSMLSHLPFPSTLVPAAVLGGVSWRRFTVRP